MLLWHALLFGVLSLVTGTSPDIGVALAALLPAAQEHGLGYENGRHSIDHALRAQREFAALAPWKPCCPRRFVHALAVDQSLSIGSSSHLRLSFAALLFLCRACAGEMTERSARLTQDGVTHGFGM